MMWLRSIRLVLPVLALAFCAAAAPVVYGALPEPPAAAGHEGGHCPDSGTGGAPCESSCVCLCCHAPAQFHPPLDAGAGPGAGTIRRLAIVAPDGARPDDPVQSIFHPPQRLTPA